MAAALSLSLMKLTVTAIFTLAFIFSFSVLSRVEYRSVGLMKKMMMVGSRPPGCVNKCWNCRPCLATLVVPVHQHPQTHNFYFKALSSSRSQSSSRKDEDDDDGHYYLLHWKCTCGNKLYHP